MLSNISFTFQPSFSKAFILACCASNDLNNEQASGKVNLDHLLVVHKPRSDMPAAVSSWGNEEIRPEVEIVSSTFSRSSKEEEKKKTPYLLTLNRKKIGILQLLPLPYQTEDRLSLLSIFQPPHKNSKSIPRANTTRATKHQLYQLPLVNRGDLRSQTRRWN